MPARSCNRSSPILAPLAAGADVRVRDARPLANRLGGEAIDAHPDEEEDRYGEE